MTMRWIGQNPGDAATLQLNCAYVVLGDCKNGNDAPIVLAAAAGSTGSHILGGGPGTAAGSLLAREVTGGVGGGTIQFRQSQSIPRNAPASPSYTVPYALTRNLGVTQNGPGITDAGPEEFLYDRSDGGHQRPASPQRRRRA